MYIMMGCSPIIIYIKAKQPVGNAHYRQRLIREPPLGADGQAGGKARG